MPGEAGAGATRVPRENRLQPRLAGFPSLGLWGPLTPREVREQRAVGRWPGEPCAGGGVGASRGVWSCQALSEPRGQGAPPPCRGSEGAGGRAAPVCVPVGRPRRRKGGEPCPSQALPAPTPVVLGWLTARWPRFVMAVNGVAPRGSPVHRTILSVSPSDLAGTSGGLGLVITSSPCNEKRN